MSIFSKDIIQIQKYMTSDSEDDIQHLSNPTDLAGNAPITAIRHCAMSKLFYYIILDQCFSKCDK